MFLEHCVSQRTRDSIRCIFVQLLAGFLWSGPSLGQTAGTHGGIGSLNEPERCEGLTVVATRKRIPIAAHRGRAEVLATGLAVERE